MGFETRKLREEIVRNVHYAVRDKFVRDTGSDIRCYVTSELDAVVGEIRSRDGLIRFSIPVTLTFEPEPNAMMAPGADLGARRMIRDEPQA